MELGEEDDDILQGQNFKHKFTCHTTKNSVILQFSIEDLRRMELEYFEVFEELFVD